MLLSAKSWLQARGLRRRPQSIAPSSTSILDPASDPTSPVAEGGEKVQMQPKTSANLALLESGDGFDFVIESQGVEFKVHYDKVCPPSSFLRGAVEGGSKVYKRCFVPSSPDDVVISKAGDTK
jgi:hypothetical protein